MTDHAAASANAAPERGEQEITEQVNTFRDVMGLVKWASLAIACAVMLLVIWFCTGAGLFTGLVVAALMAGAGGWFLSRKPAAAHD